MQDTDDLKPKPEEDEDITGPEAGESDLSEFFDEKPLADMESSPGESMPETPEEESVPPVQEMADTPDDQPIELLEEDELVEDQPIPDKAVESKTRRFFRKLIRWTTGILIVFGLGFLSGFFLIHQPAMDESENALQQITADLDAANDKIFDLQTEISDLKTQIADLEPLEDANAGLLAAQNDFQLHVAILEARVDIASARLPLMATESAQARVILDKTGESLDLIYEFLDPSQQDVAVAMTDRLNLVLSEIDDDPYAAESDLDVLATKLLELEDALFSD